ncbi:MAG: ABC transporter ATP-binding protein [Proteobacteria bacterium]|nr:ABC transporter ATP-binding protein [Pseudomonadota bacterium]
MEALTVTDLYKSYHKIPVLRGLSFSVQQGEFFGFAGVNGAGKSTFLKCMLDFCHYESGDISVFGTNSKKTQARECLAFLPERFIPPYYLTGGQFLRMMMRLHNAPFDQQRAEQMSTELDLDLSALSKPVRSFSKGMTQKLGLLGCFMADRDFYILDEPMSGLDPKARALVKRQFDILRARGATLFFTSHALSDIEEVCSRMAVLHNGNICFAGTPSEMRAQYPTATSLEECYLQAINADPQAVAV